MEASINNHLRVISGEKLDKSLYYLQMYHNKNLIPDKVYSELRVSLQMAIECTKSFRYKVLIAGLINSGKSTFVNTLVGKFILHTSVLENTRWPIVIRHAEENTPALYAAKMANEFLYELEEGELLAKGDESVCNKLIELNSDKGVQESFRDFLLNLGRRSQNVDITQKNIKNKLQNEKNKFCEENARSTNESSLDDLSVETVTKPVDVSEISLRSDQLNKSGIHFDEEHSKSEERHYKFEEKQHSQFIFILHCPIQLGDGIAPAKVDRQHLEIWDIPGLNMENNFFNDYILNNLIQNERNINLSFPFLASINSMRRLTLLYVSDYANFNQAHNLVAWNSLDVVRQLAKKTYFVVNKIDQQTEDDAELLGCELEPAIRAKFPAKEDDTAYHSLSSLYSYLELCEKKKELDDFYWRSKKKIFATTASLRKEFKSFERYKKYTIARLEDAEDDRSEGDYLKDFCLLTEDLCNSLGSNKFLECVMRNHAKILKSFIFDQEVRNDQSLLNNEVLYESAHAMRKRSSSLDSFSTKPLSTYFNSNQASCSINNVIQIVNPLNSIQRIFSSYFGKMRHHVKFDLNITKIKLRKNLASARKEIDEYVAEVHVFNKEKYQRVAEIYKQVISNIKMMKHEFRQRISSENESLLTVLRKELEIANLRQPLVNYFLADIECGFDRELKNLDDNFLLRSNDLLQDLSYALSNGIFKGAVAFLGTNIVQSMVSGKTVGAAFFTSSLLCFFIAVGCLIFCTYKHFDTVNEQNRESLHTQEKELWARIQEYDTRAYETMKIFASGTCSRIKQSKLRINGFFSFIKKTLC